MNTKTIFTAIDITIITILSLEVKLATSSLFTLSQYNTKNTIKYI